MASRTAWYVFIYTTSSARTTAKQDPAGSYLARLPSADDIPDRLSGILVLGPVDTGRAKARVARGAQELRGRDRRQVATRGRGFSSSG